MSIDASPSLTRTTSSPDDGTLTLTIAARTVEADGVVSLTLRDPGGRSLPTWTPGAHIDLHVDATTVRQYSLSSSPSSVDTWRVSVLDEVDGRGGSRAIHERFHEGMPVRVSRPRNHFPLGDAENYVFIAGGIGITPLLPMIDEVEQRGAAWQLVYTGRSLSTMAFTDELQRHGERVTLIARDAAERMDFNAYLRDVRQDTLVYACGPERLLIELEQCTSHWPSGSLHVERFEAQDIDVTGDGEFEVEFVQSGLTVSIPADESILDVAEEHELDVMASCAEGTCGTCETPVLEGTPDHRDAIQSADEKSKNCSFMYICVSRSVGGCKLKLDL